MTQQHPFWQIIRTVPDFPKAGIEFYDITPLLNEHIDKIIDELIACLPVGVFDEVDYLVGVESRGFLFASLLAGRTGKGMTVVRKAGKLPPPVVSLSYDLEYGSDTLQMQQKIGQDNKKVLIIDDILATGGTLKATHALCKQAGYDVIGALVLIDLVDLHQDIGLPVFTVLKA